MIQNAKKIIFIYNKMLFMCQVNLDLISHKYVTF